MVFDTINLEDKKQGASYLQVGDQVWYRYGFHRQIVEVIKVEQIDDNQEQSTDVYITIKKPDGSEERLLVYMSGNELMRSNFDLTQVKRPRVLHRGKASRNLLAGGAKKVQRKKLTGKKLQQAQARAAYARSVKAAKAAKSK